MRRAETRLNIQDIEQIVADGVADRPDIGVDMGCGVVRHSAGLTRVRIADHGNPPEIEVENVDRGVLVIVMREGRNVSHRAVNYALLVSNYPALFHRVTVPVVVRPIL